MELEQILQEIRDSQVYSAADWKTYLACFTALVQTNVARLPAGAPGGEIARRICQGQSSIRDTRLVSSKVVTPRFLEEERERDPMTLGVVSGCYDLLHLGHVKGMLYAKDYLGQFQNGKLCVLCLSDGQIRGKKGRGRPVLNVNERLSLIDALSCVDYAIVLDAPNCLGVLGRLRPDWYIKSEADLERDVVRQEVERVQELGGQMHLFPESVANITSTTEIIQKVRRQLCPAEDQ